MSAGLLNAHDKFLFDLNGFIVVRDVFTPEEVAAANAAVDAHATDLVARSSDSLRNAKAGTPMSAAGPRRDLGGLLYWPEPHSTVFRRVLDHPKLVPYLTAFCGEGYRLDHQPQMIVQDRDSEGFSLHGGPISGDDGVPHGRFNPELQYRCVGGDMWTSLLAVSVQLCDHNEGDGGFCVLRGSHKLNLPVPTDFATGVAPSFREHVHQPVTRAGDVVLFSEATVHGATPWLAAHQRRIALYRFSPANLGYGRGYLEIPATALEGMSARQRAVLEPPYASRLERPLLSTDDADDAPLRKKARNAAKKELDQRLFGTSYF